MEIRDRARTLARHSRRTVGAAARGIRERMSRNQPPVAEAVEPSPVAAESEPVAQTTASPPPDALRHLRTRSIRNGPISERLGWSPESPIHPAFEYREGPRREVQQAAHDEVVRLLAADPYEHHACPSCGGTGWYEIATVERLGLHFPTCVCRFCGLVQAEPRPTQAFYDRFYSDFYRELFEGRTEMPTVGGFHERASRRPQRFVDWVLQQPAVKAQVGERDLILEVGCSAGLVVSRFAAAGHRVVGLDLDPDFMRIGQELGFDLRLGKLDTVELDERPAMIYYHHVIEHIADIATEIEMCAELLPPGGLLVLAVPGLDYVWSAYRGDLLRYLQLPHVYNFSLVSLCALLLPRGFELVSGDETVRAVFRRCDPRPADDLYAIERAVAVWRLKNLEVRFATKQRKSGFHRP